MQKKCLLILTGCFVLQFCPVFSAERIDKILQNSEYSQEQKIEKISKRADELLRNSKKARFSKSNKEIQNELDSTDSQGLNAIKLCAFNGDVPAVEKLIKLNVPLNSNQNSKPSVLMLALKNPQPNLSMIQLLVENGADCDFYLLEKINGINHKTTILNLACTTENPEIINYIIPECSKNLDSKMPQLNKNGILNSKNALILLCESQIKYFKADSDINFYHSIELLLKKRSNLVNSDFFDNGYKGTALHIAAKNNEKNLYKLLRKYGANPQTQDSVEKSSIQYLQDFCVNDVDSLDLMYEEYSKKEINLNKTQLIKNIIQNDINQQSTSDKKTALVIAIQNQDEETINVLLDADADYEICDNLGKNAIHYSIDQNSQKLLEEFFNKGYVPQKADLEYAILENKTSMINYLLTKSPHFTKDELSSLLFTCIKYNDSNLLKMILPFILRENKNVLEMNLQGGLSPLSQGLTPFLFAAANNSDPKVLKILRMYGANVFALDKQKRNAADLAKAYNKNFQEIIEYLNKYGVYENGK